MPLSPAERSRLSNISLIPPPELSPDVEWMLQSGQVSDSTLIAVLVREQYENIERHSLALLEDPAEADEATRQTLVAAVMNAHQFGGESSVDEWLTALAEKICRKKRSHRHPTTSTSLSAGPSPSRPPAPQFWGVRGAAMERGEVPPSPPPPSVFFPPSAVCADGGIEGGDFDAIRLDLEARVARARERRRISILAQEIGLVVAAILLVSLFGGIYTALAPTQPPNPTYIQTELVTVVVYITATPRPTATPAPTNPPTPSPPEAVSYTVEKDTTLREVSNRLGISLPILQALNDLAADASLSAGRQVVVGFGASPMSLITPTPLIPAAPPEPLTLQSDIETIHRRARESRQYWHTLWAEAQVVIYGPNNYVGPPQVKCQQLWVSQPATSLALSGRMDGSLEQVSLAVENLLYSQNLENGYREINSTGGELYYLELGELFSLYFDFFEGNLEVLRIASIAGREAIVVDWYWVDTSFVDEGGEGTVVRSYQGRYWIDTLTGAILRRQRFDYAAPGVLSDEVIITRIAFDVNFSNRLFDQYQPFPTRLARDVHGDPLPPDAPLAPPAWAPPNGHEPQPRRTPPPDFDPSHSRLTFQWTRIESLGAPSTMADIFAGRFYLGNVRFGDPFFIRCARSPDGEKIAFWEWPQGPLPEGAHAAPVRWFSLRDITRVREVLAGMTTVGEFAFAPDNRRLAIYACAASERGDCGIYLVDTATGQETHLLDMDHAFSLVWKPDSSSLAFIGAPSQNTVSTVWVVNAQNGEVIYNGMIEYRDYSQMIIAADSPTHSWGVAFPVWRGGLEACAEPPKP